MRGGDRVESGEARKEVWNEAFSKLGKFDLNDKNFDKEVYLKTKKKVQEWEERKVRDRTDEDLDKDGDRGS